jgi:hypothetical protein
MHTSCEVPAKLEERLGRKFMRADQRACEARVQRLDRLEGGELVIVLRSEFACPWPARRASVMRELRVR